MEELIFQYPIESEQPMAKEMISEQADTTKMRLAIMLLVLVSTTRLPAICWENCISQKSVGIL